MSSRRDPVPAARHGAAALSASAVVVDQVLLRYRYVDGRIATALPMWSVETTAERTVGWLTVGTEIRYWALPDGSDPRSVPIGERFATRHAMTSAAREWSGSSVLRVMPRDRPYQVVHFWHEGGRFAGWYVNFETPSAVMSATVDSRDWHLDLWLPADADPVWKDEDEAEMAVRHGHLGADELALARTTGEAILADRDAWVADVGDWRDFRPDTTWGPLPLPADWADRPRGMP